MKFFESLVYPLTTLFFRGVIWGWT